MFFSNILEATFHLWRQIFLGLLLMYEREKLSSSLGGREGLSSNMNTENVSIWCDPNKGIALNAIEQQIVKINI